MVMKVLRVLVLVVLLVQFGTLTGFPLSRRSLQCPVLVQKLNPALILMPDLRREWVTRTVWVIRKALRGLRPP